MDRRDGRSPVVMYVDTMRSHMKWEEKEKKKKSRTNTLV